MDYPPREVLRVPDRMPELPPGIDPLKQEVLGLLTEGENMSGEHLHHSVSHTLNAATSGCRGGKSSAGPTEGACQGGGWWTSRFGDERGYFANFAPQVEE